MDSRYSLRAICCFLFDVLASKSMLLIFMIPFLLAGTRLMVAGVFTACGVPSRVSLMTSDIVLFFLVSLLFFNIMQGYFYVPSFVEAFQELANAIQYAGLY